MYSAVNLYSDDVVVDVITIRENQNFHIRLFVKVSIVTLSILRQVSLAHVAKMATCVRHAHCHCATCV
jgi:hypothetical protein